MGNLSEVTGSGWNPEDESKKNGFGPIPAGDYVAVLANSTVKQTKDGTGRYVWTEWHIVEGEYAGRKFWNNLNLWNANQQAVDIARGTLAAIQLACRLPKMSDMSEAHNIPVIMSVGLRKNKDTQENENVIKGYKAKGANMEPVDAKTAGGGKPNPLM